MSKHDEENTLPELLTVRDVARELRVDDTTVRRWVKDGVVPAIDLPSRPSAGKRPRHFWRIPKTALKAIKNRFFVPAS